MLLKQAYLKEEIRRIATFLAAFDLVLDKDVTTSFILKKPIKSSRRFRSATIS
ncbi:MAG: hypothetical protein MZU97_05645 [Bacillus subtilis]|nr:hypothetical protein [Bacillus subtilis]